MRGAINLSDRVDESSGRAHFLNVFRRECRSPNRTPCTPLGSCKNRIKEMPPDRSGGTLRRDG
jgi:hypothetical protein